MVLFAKKREFHNAIHNTFGISHTGPTQYNSKKIAEHILFGFVDNCMQTYKKHFESQKE